MADIQEMIKIWKENKVMQVVFKFSCGGDSMNDTEIIIEDENGNSGISCNELSTYFEDEVYRKVEFYENSDGHYQGEFGEVIITLDDEEDCFDYCKCSQSEWCETITSEIEVQLTKKQIQFIQNKVSNCNGGDGGLAINYLRDCILSDEEEEIENELEVLFSDTAQNFSPETDGSVDEGWYGFTTNEDEEKIKIKDNILTLFVDNSVTIIKDSDY